VVGKSGPKRLEKLIGEVSRGERDLASIRDAHLREAVRIALRLHADVPEAPDAYTRARMRARIMAGLRPRTPTLWDNAWTAVEFLSRPAPYIVRGIGFAALLLCVGMATVVASADTLPDDLLYPLKLASEQVRLALADAPGDRAGVELSIAEHRLREAEALAESGRTSDALVASAMYSQHIASAAAELAPQSQNDQTDLGAQLESTFAVQRERAQSLAVILATDVKSERGAQILALIAAPTLAPGATRIERVAETAATLAVDLANAADTAAIAPAVRAVPAERAVLPVATEPQITDAPRSSSSGRVTSATPRATATARVTNTPRTVATPAPTRDPRASDAAKITRKAAEDARAAAEKLKKTLRDQHK
jgi:Domain of unknown function (DUF5667)